jgi:hypothetical protein
MSESEREILTTLCARICDEKNPDLFMELLGELEVLLDKRSGLTRQDEGSKTEIPHT